MVALEAQNTIKLVEGPTDKYVGRIIFSQIFLRFTFTHV